MKVGYKFDTFIQYFRLPERLPVKQNRLDYVVNNNKSCKLDILREAIN